MPPDPLTPLFRPRLARLVVSMARRPTYSSNWISGSEKEWITRLYISNNRGLAKLISRSMNFNLLQVVFKLSGKSYLQSRRRTLRQPWVSSKMKGHWQAEHLMLAFRKRKRRLRSSTISLLALAEVPLIVTTTRMDINKRLQRRKMRYLATYRYPKMKETPQSIWTKIKSQHPCHLAPPYLLTNHLISA